MLPSFGQIYYIKKHLKAVWYCLFLSSAFLIRIFSITVYKVNQQFTCNKNNNCICVAKYTVLEYKTQVTQAAATPVISVGIVLTTI